MSARHRAWDIALALALVWTVALLTLAAMDWAAYDRFLISLAFR